MSEGPRRKPIADDLVSEDGASQAGGHQRRLRSRCSLKLQRKATGSDREIPADIACARPSFADPRGKRGSHRRVLSSRLAGPGMCPLSFPSLPPDERAGSRHRGRVSVVRASSPSAESCAKADVSDEGYRPVPSILPPMRRFGAGAGREAVRIRVLRLCASGRALHRASAACNAWSKRPRFTKRGNSLFDFTVELQLTFKTREPKFINHPSSLGTQPGMQSSI